MKKTYMPARLCRGKDRWYITYHQVDPITGERRRFRETFDLNRIKDKRVRIREAKRIIEMVNRRLPLGYPFEDFTNSSLNAVRLTEALDKAIRYKHKTTDRKSSERTYTYVIGAFNDYLKKQHLTDILLVEFGTNHAKQFLQWATMDRGVSNRTRNNYLSIMRATFNAAIEFYPGLAQNPFATIKSLPERSAQRRALSMQERQAIIAEIKADPALMLGISLQYYCFIRPVEISRLQFQHIDLVDGFIRLPSSITKNKRSSAVQIPDNMLAQLEAYGVGKHPPDWHVIGRNLEPAPKQAKRDSLSRRHQRIITRMVEEKKLTSKDMIKFYSWKDTGVVELVRRKVNIREIQLQLRHSSLDMTQKYLESLGFQYSEIKTLDNRLI